MDTQKQRQQFLSAMNAQDISVFARDIVTVEGEYAHMQHRINAKNKIGLWILFFSSCLLLAVLL